MTVDEAEKAERAARRELGDLEKLSGLARELGGKLLTPEFWERFGSATERLRKAERTTFETREKAGKAR